MTPVKVIYEIRYSDDSGAKHRVEYDAGKDNDGRVIVSGCGDSNVWLDPVDLDWLIDALQEVRHVIHTSQRNQ